jgi:hypothetical protein
MTSKKGSKGSNTSGLTALKIGSRVRCTDDGVEGRITWANGVAVKVQWDDGEQVIWRRDSLAERPIEILGGFGEERHAATSLEQVDEGQNNFAEVPNVEPPPVPQTVEGDTAGPEQPAANTSVPAAEPATVDPVPPTHELDEGQAAPVTPDATAETTVPAKQRRKNAAPPKEKKLSALDAAAQVLAEIGQAMTCQEIIAAMAEKGYWKSPGGLTPAATLYSAILKEITTKGAASRFVKTDRGKFARTGVA